MSISGALTSGVSGLQVNSSALGAIADNISNSNTIGYKRTESRFSTLVTQQISGTQYSPGGVQDNVQSEISTQGLLSSSTSSLDAGISGQGFFVTTQTANAATSDTHYYTRWLPEKHLGILSPGMANGLFWQRGQQFRDDRQHTVGKYLQ